MNSKAVLCLIGFGVAIVMAAGSDGLTDMDVYRSMGIPEEYIQNHIREVHTNARQTLLSWARGYRVSNNEIYQAIKRLKDVIEYAQRNYLQNVNNIVLGNNNRVNGQDNVLRGSNYNVKGTDNYVFNNKFSHAAVQGDHIILIGKFLVDFDKIEQIRSNPQAAITTLNRQ